MTDPLKRELAIGVILRTHGVRGHVRVRSFSGEAEHFRELREVRLQRSGQEVLRAAVEEVSAGAGSDSVLLKLAGFDSPEQARALIGCELWVDRDQAAPLAAGEYYVADLIGCRALGPAGPVGTVSGVMNAGAGDVLEIRGDDGKGYLVPFRDGFVGEVDLASATVRLTEDPAREVGPPEGGPPPQGGT